MQLYDLEPVSAHLCLTIEKTCRQKFALAPGQRLLLAVSGGADSLAMTLIFHVIAQRLDVALSALHINHMLRQEAEQEAAFAQKFCADLGIDCICVNIDVNKIAKNDKCGLEEAGRNARRSLLLAEADRQKADFILLGHHRNDLAEDILMRLARGTGWPGLGGMNWQNGKFIRPLLHTDPQELREFLLACGYSWQEDSSNQSLQFQRNRFRHIFLPLLRCENPGLETGLLRLHDQARLDEEFWTSLLEEALARHPWQIQTDAGRVELLLDRELLAGLHAAARMRLYLLALREVRKLAARAGQSRADTLANLDRAWQSGIGNKTLQCGNGVMARCENGGIRFHAPKDQKNDSTAI